MRDTSAVTRQLPDAQSGSRLFVLNLLLPKAVKELEVVEEVLLEEQLVAEADKVVIPIIFLIFLN